MYRLRWSVFKLLSAIAYWVCPEPDRSVFKTAWGIKLHALDNAAVALMSEKELDDLSEAANEAMNKLAERFDLPALEPTENT